MRIIRTSKDKKDVIKIIAGLAKCKVCDCVFKWDYDDICLESAIDEKVRFLKCPECGHFLEVK